jgi:cytochrome P450 family 2 subfamily J
MKHKPASTYSILTIINIKISIFCRTLRDFGFGKGTTEDLVQCEVTEFLQRLEMEYQKGKKIEFRGKFHIFVMSSLWTIVSGEKLSPEDPKMVKLMTGLDQLFVETGATVVQMAFFSERMMQMVDAFGLAQVFTFIDKLWAMIDPIIDGHRATIIKDNPRDFTDCFFDTIYDTSTPAAEKESKISLRNVLADLFIAGSETTSTMLTWAVLFMAKYPEIQNKVQAELDQVCGTQTPSYTDRTSLPYTEATITEVYRRANIVPIRNCWTEMLA